MASEHAGSESIVTATGRCLCGGVTFRFEGVGTDLSSCHCSMCRRWSGGPALAVTGAKVTFTGSELIERFASSDWAERGFCRRCGSHLFYRLKATDQYFAFMGAFDDQSAFKLTGEIYIDSKPPGYAFSGDHPRLTEQEFLATWQKS